MKTPYVPAARNFDPNFFLCGDSGAGKTHFTAAYVQGPVHFYMFDRGGEKTIDKLIDGRPENAPITVDYMSKDETKFSDIWSMIQQDEKDGFFDEMAEKNGIVVFDSITTLNMKAIQEICGVNKRITVDIGKARDDKKGMRIQDWGQLLNWMTTLVSGIQDLPCATASTVHLHTIMDGEQSVVARYPSVNGQFRQLCAVNYDEVYLLRSKANSRVVHFTEHMKFTAKSRAFTMDKAKDITLNDLALLYMSGKTNFTEK